MKDKLWDLTFGEEAGIGKCEVCDIKINSKRFEAGHVISVHCGGKTNVSNLRCICSTCNKSMGTMDLNKFKKKYFPELFYSQKIMGNTKLKKKWELYELEKKDVDSMDEEEEEEEEDEEIIEKMMNIKLVEKKISNLSKFKFNSK